MGLLPDSYLMQPFLHIKGRTGLARVQLMVSYDAYLREAAVEVLHIAFQSLALCYRPRIFRLHTLIAPTYIYDVPAYAVETGGTVGNLPRVDAGIFVIVHKPFYATVEVHHIRVTHLLPATPSLAYRVGVPVAYLRGAYLTVFRRGGAVDYKILYRLTHRLQNWGQGSVPDPLHRYQDFRPTGRQLPLCRGYMQGQSCP